MEEIVTKRVSKGRLERDRKEKIHNRILFEQEQHKAELEKNGKKDQVIQTRKDRRFNLQLGKAENMRKVKRAKRFTELTDEARAIKKKYPKNFKKQKRWGEIDIEVAKILSHKGGSNITKPKKKR